MFKRNRFAVAAAFCFGLAFSFAAFAQQDCTTCSDACYERYEQCNLDGLPFTYCKAELRACKRACGCPT